MLSSSLAKSAGSLYWDVGVYAVAYLQHTDFPMLISPINLSIS